MFNNNNNQASGAAISSSETVQVTLGVLSLEKKNRYLKF